MPQPPQGLRQNRCRVRCALGMPGAECRDVPEGAGLRNRCQIGHWGLRQRCGDKVWRLQNGQWAGEGGRKRLRQNILPEVGGFWHDAMV